MSTRQVVTGTTVASCAYQQRPLSTSVGLGSGALDRSFDKSVKFLYFPLKDK